MAERRAGVVRGRFRVENDVMGCPVTPPSSQPTSRPRWAFTFQVDGDLKFISHHDTVRLFQRALARAALPVHFTQGFNPHPRLSLPLPRPVGVATDVDVIVLEFDGDIDGEEACRALAQQMPAGIKLTDVRSLEPGARMQPKRVRYRLNLDGLETVHLAARVEELLSATSLPIQRTGPDNKAAKSMDVRPFLDHLEILDRAVEFELIVTQAGTAKPAEIAALLGFDDVSINNRIRRVAVDWQVQQKKSSDP